MLNVVITTAKTDDVNQILDICKSHILRNSKNSKEPSAHENQGFLIHEPKFSEIEEIINDKKDSLLLVAKKGDEVLGYLTGQDLSKMKKEIQDAVFQLEDVKKSNGKIFYHKQIGKKIQTNSERGISKNLLLKMFDEAKLRGYLQVICKIVHEPFLNKVSESFHTKYGFRQIGNFEEFVESENCVVKTGIYLKDL